MHCALCIKELFLLKVQCHHNHLATPRVYTIREYEHILVRKVLAVLLDDIPKTVAELDLWDELEPRSVEVTTESTFKVAIEALKQQLPLSLYCKVEGRIDTSHEVWTVVVESLCAELKIDRQ